MEDKNRIKLADRISELLTQNETEAMRLWKESAAVLKCPLALELPEYDVLACTYNSEAYLEHALQSVLFQSYQCRYFIVVNDGSTDKTAEILRRYSTEYPQLKVITNDKNKGITFSANLGLEHSISEYVSRMDLDDLIHPLKYEKQLQYLKNNPHVLALSTWMTIFNSKEISNKIQYRNDPEVQKICLLFFTPLCHAATVFKGDLIRNLKYKPEYQDRGEDFDLFYRIMKQGITSVVNEYLYFYRTHSSQITNPKHTHLIYKSMKLVVSRVLQDIGLLVTEEQLLFHVDVLMNNRPLANKKEFIYMHQWFTLILKANKKSSFLNQKKLRDFLWINHWQTAYNKFSVQLSIVENVKITFSEMHYLSLKTKTSNFFKKLIHGKKQA